MHTPVIHNLIDITFYEGMVSKLAYLQEYTLGTDP